MQKNIVGWFEIPVENMERAMKFYKIVFGHSLERHKMHSLDMAWFPMNPDGAGSMGSLVYHKDFYKPSTNGTLVYFTAFSGDLANELKKVEPAGGKILVPKTQLSPDYGFMALLLDTEGNRIGIHSRG
ncbi:MAG: VOC family protein [Candidatus Bilamarchaeum sp.]|jgi:predicted enzyme related to lactoylglutathione lyase